MKPLLLRISLMLSVLIITVVLIDLRVTRHWNMQEKINQARYNDITNLFGSFHQQGDLNDKLIAGLKARGGDDEWLAGQVLKLWQNDLKFASNAATLMKNQEWLATNSQPHNSIIIFGLNDMTNTTLASTNHFPLFYFEPQWDTNLLEELRRDREERDRKARERTFIKVG